ncbi:thiamine diphosphokinase [Lactobacillus sp. PV037]|uniref:thiamine diphosphokinase n=1 Tax=Lactobacillus sp. PV037 TaxID=2594496 RepID=UPI00223FB841|nr:thiamine diphosphokinase [Lactobacillus sp. PV037]QNQ83872.1 thiamine diphosphokinase [Lactobacillus sp. PV037]
MEAIALLGGPREQWPQNIKERFEKARKKNKLIFSSDRGTLILKQWGLTPDVAVGDFDSIKKNEKKRTLESIPDVRFSNPVKDYTDSEQLLVTALQEYQVDNLEIYGATGGRIDHLLVNLFTFLHSPLQEYLDKVSLVDKQNIIYFCKTGKMQFPYQEGYNYIGFGNLTPVEDFEIKDARYELSDFSSKVPQMFSSNEFLRSKKAIKISLKKGIVIAIYSRDEKRFFS